LSVGQFSVVHDVAHREHLEHREHEATAYPRAPERAAELAVDLDHAVRGEVRFDNGTRALYSTGGSNYRQIPIGVVVPYDVDDIVAGIEVCRRHDVPVLPRGGGTSLAGQTTNVAVVFDCSKYLRGITTLDPSACHASVEPGVVLDQLRDAAEEHHLTFGPDPATHTHCTLGGMIGNNSCGVHSVMAGRTVDNVETLDVLTYDGLRMTVGATSDADLARIVAEGGRRGEIYRGLRDLRDRYADLVRARYPRIPRRVSGYNLDELLPENGFDVARALVGTEGTCVMILGATVRLVNSPPARVVAVLGFQDVFDAADRVPELVDSGCIGLEGLDDVLTEDVRRRGDHADTLALLPEGHGWLVAEFGGPTLEDARAQADALVGRAKKWANVSGRVYEDEADQKGIWKVRESGLGATARVPGEPDTWEGWEDSAVPPDRLGLYLRRLSSLYKKYGYKGALYGHFGQGCVHTRIDFDLASVDGINRWRRFMDDATDLVVELGGSLSGEHGDGQSRAEFLPKMFGPELVTAFGEFKRIWDPGNRMNPGKIVDPYRIDDNLRLGPDYDPVPQKTWFALPEDGGDFARATLRCVGVGECRRTHGGTMCPSYMVTHEEMHSTRGRARLLFEMLNGLEATDTWRDEHVKEALDLCLACKGCKSDCPVNVDMATYKSEFLAHYYAGRLRPRTAYSMGLIMYAARAATRFPRLANLATHAPGLRAISKQVAGIAPERDVPRFATRSFRQWFADHEPANPDGSPVLLWADTFTNAFEPRIAQAAVSVLERAGHLVRVPEPWLCCGRPLYDYGFLRHAKRLLRRTLDTLADDIEAGTPLVVLEPSCAAVFRDELGGLFPRQQDARRLALQTHTLAEFLDHVAPTDLPRLEQKAVVHRHCHHHAVMGFDADERVLERLGLDTTLPDSGCCGMAGSFGFERQHYDISQACGERVLLPAVRSTDADTLVLADGFSCREQIRQATGRRALHLAEVIDLASTRRT
jgi:FAD/FMN-containing dehydrogenase/Fe-S oxidoreductase